jgi:hypothetical protein
MKTRDEQNVERAVERRRHLGREGVRLDGFTYAVRRDDDFVKSVRQKSGEFIYAARG